MGYWESACGRAKLWNGDCLEVMRALPDGCVDAVVTDPPYFRVVNEPWDRAWSSEEVFIEWIGECVEQWARILKPNGSLYCFASWQMATRVELEIRRAFTVLNRIKWVKPNSRRLKAKFSECRAWISLGEEVVFAELPGSDRAAKGLGTYHARCAELRGFVFDPLRRYLADECERAGWTCGMIDTQWQKERGGKGGMAGHWLGKSQWALPTAKNYEWLRGLLNNGEAGLFLSREYEDLRREYEDLRREYEDLRRPFSLDRYGAFSDVWQFSPVAPHDGRHICEKPQEMLMRILEVSTRPGAVVFDSFFGSGSMGEACGKMGRRFWGSEMSADWFDKARRRVAGAFDSPVGTNREPVQVRAVKRSGSEPANFEQLGLFG